MVVIMMGRMRHGIGGALIVLCALTTAACGFWSRTNGLPRYDPSIYAVTPTPAPTAPPEFAWANGAEYAIVVRKHERTLALYHRTQQEKVYPVVIGIAPSGPKTYRGDLRTPEGVYRIVAKRPHERWSRFMLLSYPNDVDRRRYAMALNEGRVPIIDGEAPGPGNAVGIHGTDRENANVSGVDWTWGCISLLNPNIEELYEIVPLGTPVRIEE
jgi:murein L,D-transpeptidase YafK